MLLRAFAALFWFGWAALFGYAFLDRYWRRRDCFNDLGRCYDPVDSVVYLEQSGMIWGGLAAICLGLGLWAAWSAWGRRPARY